ncbi:adhesin [Bordetella trematum]|nr:adhesin [Bordetella trematum]
MSLKKLARKLWTGRASREVQQSLFRRRPLFEALERRYLMSAELVVPPPPAAEDQPPQIASVQPGAQGKKASAPGAHPYLVERAAFQKAGALGEALTLDEYAKAQQARQGDAKAWLPGAQGANAALNGIEGYTSHDASTQVRQIIFVDPTVDNAEELVQGLYSLVSGKTEGLGGLLSPQGEGPQLQVLRNHDTEIIVLDGRYDGVEQITEILAQHRDLAAVQIMSHGQSGELTLGTATLGQRQLESYKDQLRAWGDALSDDGDLMLYGCNVAAGKGGVAFVDSLSAITRADVAAATHSVGSAALGGDWVLDYRSGAIEASTVTVARWDGLMASVSGQRDGGSTLTGVATGDTLIGYGSDNTFVFNNNSTAAVSTIELRQGMKQENGVWVRNADDENSNNTLDFSAVKGDITAIIHDDSHYQISYKTQDGQGNWSDHIVNVVFKSADGSEILQIGGKTFNLVGTALDGKTILDYSGYATGVTVDLSGPSEGSNGEEIPPPPPTGFGYVRNIGGVIGSTRGGNKITVVGDTMVTINHKQDIIKGSGGDNTYIVADGIKGFTLSQQSGQSGNTLDLSRYNADLTAQVHTQGGVTVYLGAGVGSDGSIRDLSGATALVNQLDIQVFIGADGKTTLDYTGYEDNVTVNLNYQDGSTALYDASGLAGVLNVNNVIGGLRDNDIVGSQGSNIITVANSQGHNRISGGGGNDLVIGTLRSGGATEYIGGVTGNAQLSDQQSRVVLTGVLDGVALEVTLVNVGAVTLQDYRSIDSQAAVGSQNHANTTVTLDASNYSGDLTLIGSAGANVLKGGSGTNVFRGYQGDNVLIAHAGAQRNVLFEEGDWNLTLTPTELQAVLAPGVVLAPGQATPVLHNQLQGTFHEARLNGGLASTLIDASAFVGDTLLVSGQMAGGTIKSGNGANSRHQIVLMGGRYDITGASAAGATTQLVVKAGGLTGLDPASLKQQLAQSGGAAWVAFQSTGNRQGWIQQAENAVANASSTYRDITSVKVISGEYGNHIDTSAFEGQAELDGRAGLSNLFIISNAHATQVTGSAGQNTIQIATGNQDLLLNNGELILGSGSSAIRSTFTHVNDFDITVQGTDRKVDTRQFTGVTRQTFLADLTGGYEETDGPALTVELGGGLRIDIGLQGVRTLQELLDAIGAAVVVNADGKPVRIAVEGPYRGHVLPDDNSTTAWDYLYALRADLDAQGRLEIAYSQQALDAGFSGVFTLRAGAQLQLDGEGNASESNVQLSTAAWALGLLGQGQVSAQSSAAGVLHGAVLAIGHYTHFTLASSKASVYSGGGNNLFSVNFVSGAGATGGGNNLYLQAGAVNRVAVQTHYDTTISGNQVVAVDGASKILSFVGVLPTELSVAATNTSGTVILDASGWDHAISLISEGAANELKGNTSNVRFVVQQPASGQVTVSLKAAGGQGNSIELLARSGASAATSGMLGANAALIGVQMGANTGALGYVLDLGEHGVVDSDLGLTGRNVTVRARVLEVKHGIDLDSSRTLRLEGEKITIGEDTGANIVVTAGVVQIFAQRYRPWRSSLAQIYTLKTDITVKNATLWASQAGGEGLTLQARIDSEQYDDRLQPFKNAADQRGVLGMLATAGNKAIEAALTFLDGAGAMASWAAIQYKSSITVGSQARLLSQSDISVRAQALAKVDLSPLVAKIAGSGWAYCATRPRSISPAP